MLNKILLSCFWRRIGWLVCTQPCYRSHMSELHARSQQNWHGCSHVTVIAIVAGVTILECCWTATVALPGCVLATNSRIYPVLLLRGDQHACQACSDAPHQLNGSQVCILALGCMSLGLLSGRESCAVCALVYDE